MAFIGPHVAGQDIFASSATQLHGLGTQADTGDGRLFRYGLSAAASVAGCVYQSAATIPDHLANTPPIVAIYAKSFEYTPGATAGAANLYAEGFLQVDTTPGAGYTYRVSGHAAISASTAFTLYLKDPLQVALTATSRVGLIASPWKNVIIAPDTAITAKVIGVAPAVIAAGGYGWFQSRGPCSVLINGTPAITAPVMNGLTTAGSVDVWTAAAQPTSNLLGHMMQVGVSTKYNFVYLAID